MSVNSIKHCRAHLHEWMEIEPRPVSWLFAPARAEVVPQPLGVVGIISAVELPDAARARAARQRPRRRQPRHDQAQRAHAEDRRAHGQDHRGDLQPRTRSRSSRATARRWARRSRRCRSITCSSPARRASARSSCAPRPRTSSPSRSSSAASRPPSWARTSPSTSRPRASCTASCFNAGQTCIAPDYVARAARQLDRFVDECKAAVAKMFPTLKDEPRLHEHRQRAAPRAPQGPPRGGQGGRRKVVEMNPAKEDLDDETRKMAPTLVVDRRRTTWRS